MADFLQSGFGFVVSHLQVNGDLPIDVIDGCQFRAAKPNELPIIKKMLDSAAGPMWHSWPKYECVIREERQGSSTKFHFDSLPPNQWKYWVVTFEGSNALIHRIADAARLLENDFDIGFEVFYNQENQQGDPSGYSGIPHHLIEKYGDHEFATSNARKVQAVELGRIRNIVAQLEALDGEMEFIKHAFKNFSSIERVSKRSEMRIVGYFSIIESLITHPPRLAETLDSISHQIRNKAILIGKRFARQVRLADHFLPASEEKHWQLLYSYRSCIAHGSPADFQSTYQVLKSQGAVADFLREFVKELILFSLNDSELVMDLKRC